MSKKEIFAELAKSGRAGYSVIDTALDKITELEQVALNHIHANESLERQLAAKDSLLRQAREALCAWETYCLDEEQCDAVIMAIDKEIGK